MKLSSSGLSNSLRLAILVAFASASLLAQSEPSLQQAIQRSKDIQSRIIGRACAGASLIECMQPEVDQLRDVLKQYTLSRLNQTRGDVNSLRGDLRQLDDAYVFELAGKSRPARPDKPPFVFRETRASREMIITVNHFSCGALAIPPGLVIVQGYRREGNEYVFADETGDSISGILDYNEARLLASPNPGEVWLLLVGQVAGFMGHLDRARIYSFDGYVFRERWSPEDREQMSLTAQGGQIRSNYLGTKVFPPGGIGFPRQDNLEETVDLTANGATQRSVVNHGDNPPNSR
jgi:hypothetical protein